MIEQQITFGSKQLPYNVKFSNRKTLGINVYPSGYVVVTAPLKTQLKDIKLKVRQKTPWIFKQLDQFGKFRPETPPRRYVSGETHLYLGRQYRLKVIKDNVQSIKLYRGHLWIYTKNIQSDAVKIQLENWYTLRARELFPQLLEEILPLSKRYLKKQPSLIIRKMSKRWGSCTQAGKILLNPELMKASKGCIEYVIIHELCHLIFYHHNKQFYNLLGRVMPNWNRWKYKLENSQI